MVNKRNLARASEQISLYWKCDKKRFYAFVAALLLVLVVLPPGTYGKAPALDNTWVDKTTTIAPPVRGNAPMVYDSRNRVVVLFGGGSFWTQYNNYLGDTWVYSVDTNTWTEMNPSPAPSSRTFHGLAYDSRAEVVVLFGGVHNTYEGALGDTWIYNVKTNTWTQMFPTDSPSPRAGTGLVYDSHHKKIVLHSLTPYPVYTAETWTYDLRANTWTNMNPSNIPLWSSGDTCDPVNLTYDPKNDVSVNLCYFTVWTYSLTTNSWTKKPTPAVQPPARWGTDFAYDSRLDKMILFGGCDWGAMRGDTWTYDVRTNAWSNLNPSVSPPGRCAHELVYDSKNEVVVMFGGETWSAVLSETWIYYPPRKK